mmetsp:Transcript_7611/g.19409  ORF Transcript_7611/g.19409 Transcript_7611/m.19409 type:complete len:300 (-) Transcript_7611:492-1391(-)
MQPGRMPLDRLDVVRLQADIEELQRLIAEYDQAIGELQAASDAAANETQALTQENMASEQELEGILGPEQFPSWLFDQLPESHDVVEVRPQEANLLQRVLFLLRRDASLLRAGAGTTAPTDSQGSHAYSSPLQDLQHSSFDGAACNLHQMLQLMESECMDRLHREQNLVNLREFLQRQHEMLTTSRRLIEAMLEQRSSEGAVSELASVAGAPQAAAPTASMGQSTSPGHSTSEALMGLPHIAVDGAIAATPPPLPPPPPWPPHTRTQADQQMPPVVQFGESTGSNAFPSSMLPRHQQYQ